MPLQLIMSKLFRRHKRLGGNSAQPQKIQNGMLGSPATLFLNSAPKEV